MPVTGTLSLGMIWSANPPAALLCHWLYQARAACQSSRRHSRAHRRPSAQSHSAGMRYCNYADVSRPLDAQRMVGARQDAATPCARRLTRGMRQARTRRQRRLHARSARARSPLSGARLACVPWGSLCLTRRWRSLALSRPTSTTSRTYSKVSAHEGPSHRPLCAFGAARCAAQALKSPTLTVPSLAPRTWRRARASLARFSSTPS